MTRLEWNEDTARRVWQEEAREEGMAERRAEGRAEGRVEGKKETTIKMIRDFLDVGTPINFIVKATGWSEQQILALKNSIGKISPQVQASPEDFYFSFIASNISLVTLLSIRRCLAVGNLESMVYLPLRRKVFRSTVSSPSERLLSFSRR